MLDRLLYMGFRWAYEKQDRVCSYTNISSRTNFNSSVMQVGTVGLHYESLSIAVQNI